MQTSAACNWHRHTEIWCGQNNLEILFCHIDPKKLDFFHLGVAVWFQLMISWDTEFKWNMVFISTGPHLATLTLTFDTWAPKSNQLTFCSQKGNAIWPNSPWRLTPTLDLWPPKSVCACLQVDAYSKFEWRPCGTLGCPENIANGSERETFWGYWGLRRHTIITV